MLIYRIEDAAGSGLYYSGLSPDCNDNMQGRQRHPLPSEDAELSPIWRDMHWDYRNKFLFGFSTIDQLKSWVYKEEWRRDIHSAGLMVSVYKVDTFYVGATQAIFLKSSAKKIGTVDILNLDAPMVKV